MILPPGKSAPRKLCLYSAGLERYDKIKLGPVRSGEALLPKGTVHWSTTVKFFNFSATLIMLICAIMSLIYMTAHS
jgi:hypothetical protein